MVSIRWTGAAGLEFLHAGKVYLMDPYISRAGKTTIFFGYLCPRREAITRYLKTLPGELQAVMLGHTHFDHALDVPEIARLSAVPFIGSASLAVLMDLFGMKNCITVCRGRERLELPGGAALTMIPSLHGKVFLGHTPYPGDIEPGKGLPLRARDYRHGQVFSMRLELGGMRFLHVGSANLIDAELEAHACDVLFMCLPGWRSIPNYHRRLLTRVRPKVIVPFHFDDFSAPLHVDSSASDLPFLSKVRFSAQIAVHAPQAQVMWPAVNKRMEFDA